MIDTIVNAVSSLLEGLSSGFADVVANISGMFWTPGAEGATGELTILGIFALVGLALSVIYFVIRLVINFVKTRR